MSPAGYIQPKKKQSKKKGIDYNAIEEEEEVAGDELSSKSVSASSDTVLGSSSSDALVNQTTEEFIPWNFPTDCGLLDAEFIRLEESLRNLQDEFNW